jgi:predicted NUDIX family phosphoesterase
MEHVLVVPTQLFHELGYFQGFCEDVERYRKTLLDPRHTSYRPREQMEQDPSFKQLIPYVIFQLDTPEGPRVFQYLRGKGQGESRLHRLRSIGIGGHIASQDANEHEAYEQGMRRELAEELGIETEFRSRCVGLINDDQNAVGQVHLGIVHLCVVDRPALRAREAEILDAGFRGLDEIWRAIDQFETWSQICLRALFPRDSVPNRGAQ